MTDALRIRARAAAFDASHALAARQDFDGARRKAQSSLQILLDSTPRPISAAIACGKGCAMCCHLRVAAMPTEVFGLVRYLQQQFEAPELEQAITRIRQAASHLHALPHARVLLVNIACPMLGDDGACTVYPARPFNCRAYHSLDVAACRESFDNPEDTSLQHPQSETLSTIHSGVQEGLRDSLRRTGVDITQYELITALAEAFEDPDCEPRHAKGEPAFRLAIRL